MSKAIPDKRTPTIAPRRRRLRAAMGLVVGLAALVGCDGSQTLTGSGSGAAGSGPGEPILVLAAASTNTAIEEIAASFEREHGTEVLINAGPTNAVASQIIAGAPVDIFVSASVAWVDAVQQQRPAERVRRLLTSTLVIVVPRGNPAGVRSPADLLHPRVRMVALAGENVPAGVYGGQALSAAGVYEPLVEQGRIARGHDVRVTLSYVELGEAEAGVVYATDARLSEEIESVYAFPSSSHEPIVYPAVLFDRAPQRPAGRAFFDYLASPAAERIFKKHAFEVLDDVLGEGRGP